MRSKLIRIGYWLICLILVAAGISFFYVSRLPFVEIKTYLDSLTADGNVESYTQDRHDALFLKYRFLSFVVSVFGLLLFFFRKRLIVMTINQAINISVYTKEKIDAAVGKFLSEKKEMKILFLLIFAGGIILRIKQLFTPLIYDEAFTHISYVIKPLFISLSDYSYPNNHLFHTLLAHVSWTIFGEHPWALRLPSFIAGVLIIPACWFLAKKIVGSQAAIIVCLLVAAFPSMIYYSGIARGYSIIMLLFVLSLILIADPAFIKKSGALFWLLIFSALGFYTVPTYIYPYIVVMCCAIIIVGRSFSKKLFIRISFFNFSVLLVAFLLYLPVLLVSGLHSVAANEYVAPINNTNAGLSFLHNINKTFAEWTANLSPVIKIAFAACIFFFLSGKKYFVAFLASTILLVGFVLVHGVVPPLRVWSFLLPILLIVSGCGAASITEFFFSNHLIQKTILWFLLFAFAFFFSSGWNKNPYEKETVDNESVALYLKTELKDGDKFLADIPFDYPIECYMREYAVPVEYLRKENKDSKRIIFILNHGLGQKMNDVIARLKIDPARYAFPERIQVFKYSTLYEMKRVSLIAR